jgi:hypothetical protein
LASISGAANPLIETSAFFFPECLIQKRRGRRLRRAGQAGEIFKQLDLGEIKALQPVME